MPIDASMAPAAASARRFVNGPVITCTPIGSPPAEKPALTVAAGSAG